MSKKPALGRGAPTPVYIRWIHEDVLQLLKDVISKELPEQPRQSTSLEFPSILTKSLYAIIGLQTVIVILGLILIIK